MLRNYATGSSLLLTPPHSSWHAQLAIQEQGRERALLMPILHVDSLVELGSKAPEK